jgi:membrane-associated phospholipid phosphatase
MKKGMPSRYNRQGRQWLPSNSLSKTSARDNAMTNEIFQRIVAAFKKISIFYWLLPLCYIAIFLIAYFRFGIVFNATLGIVFMVVIPIVMFFTKSREFLRNIALCVSVLLTYEALEGIVGILTSNGDVIYLSSVDKAIFGFSFTAAVQNFFFSTTATTIATIFYSTHIYLVLIAMVAFWIINKNLYRGYTYSIILTAYMGLITFALFPTAPPWYSGVAHNLLTQGFNMLPNSINTIQQTLTSAEDKLAAFPSLHAAYATLFAVYTIKINPKLGFFSIPFLIGVLFSTLYLGQHYLIDLIAGIAYSLLAFFIVEKLISNGKKPQKVAGTVP